MKLSTYAKTLGLSYQTVWNWFKAGKIPNAYQLPTGTVIVPDEITSSEHGDPVIILYARTSSSQNKKILENQVERLKDYAAAKGYKVAKIIKEYGSGLNDDRKQLSNLLREQKFDKIIVENKDRLTRFGFNYIQLLTGNKIEVINESLEKDEDIIKDLISIIHCFSMKIYGLRRSQNVKQKIEETLKEIENQ